MFKSAEASFFAFRIADRSNVFSGDEGNGNFVRIHLGDVELLVGVLGGMEIFPINCLAGMYQCHRTHCKRHQKDWYGSIESHKLLFCPGRPGLVDHYHRQGI